MLLVFGEFSRQAKRKQSTTQLQIIIAIKKAKKRSRKNSKSPIGILPSLKWSSRESRVVRRPYRFSIHVSSSSVLTTTNF